MTDPHAPLPEPAPEPPVTPVSAEPPPQPPPRSTPPAATRPAGSTRWITAALVPVLAVAMFTSGAIAERSGLLGDAKGARTGADAELALIEEAWNDIQANYVDARHLDNKALAYGAIRGITSAVGDSGHTSFLTAAQAKAADQSLSGTFVGIGVQLANSATEVVVGTVLPNTPAEAAGLRSGDRIVAVDGKPTAGEAVESVISRIRGPEGTKVTLSITRGDASPFDVAIVRRTFDLPLISWTMIPGRKVAFIRLDQFATGATKGLQDAITKAKAAGATAIVFDLRGNGGGYVTEAVGVASQFVGDGTVYKSVDASGKERDIPVEKGGLATGIPLVVLADAGTASAAEIVTGAIQDSKRGQVVGEKTFGTGTVLGRFDLADGSSLRIGVEEWLTRAGRPIWHEGLQPDFTVTLATGAHLLVPDDVRSMSVDDLAAASDAQLKKALDLLQGAG